MTLEAVLTIVFVVLKLVDVVEWSWLLVLSPYPISWLLIVAMNMFAHPKRTD